MFISSEAALLIARAMNSLILILLQNEQVEETASTLVGRGGQGFDFNSEFSLLGPKVLHR